MLGIAEAEWQNTAVKPARNLDLGSVPIVTFCQGLRLEICTPVDIGMKSDWTSRVPVARGRRLQPKVPTHDGLLCSGARLSINGPLKRPRAAAPELDRISASAAAEGPFFCTFPGGRTLSFVTLTLPRHLPGACDASSARSPSADGLRPDHHDPEQSECVNENETPGCRFSVARRLLGSVESVAAG